MRYLPALLIVAVWNCALGSAQAVDITTSFTSSLGGWTGNGVFHQAGGGNPSGYARFEDNPDNPNSFIVAPSVYHGSWQSYKNVGALSFDHRIIAITGSYSGIVDYQINIFGPQDSATWFFPPATDETPWMRRVAPIQESEWAVFGDWNRLLDNVTRLEIRIEHVADNTGIDVEGIDNVKLFVLPPASADFDNDSDVDGIDFLTWQRNQGTGTFFNQGDANNSGVIDGADLAVWEAQYSGGPSIVALPEPTCGGILLTLACCSGGRFRRHSL